MDENELLTEVVKLQSAIKYISRDLSNLEKDVKDVKADLSVVEKKVDGIDYKVSNYASNCPLNRVEVERAVKDTVEKLQDKKIVMYGKLAGLIVTALAIIEGVKQLMQ